MPYNETSIATTSTQEVSVAKTEECPHNAIAEVYGVFCDAVERAWQHWPVESFKEDLTYHTSDYAREAAQRLWDEQRCLGVDLDEILGKPSIEKCQCPHCLAWIMQDCAKCGIVPDFSSVNPEALRQAAELACGLAGAAQEG